MTDVLKLDARLKLLSSLVRNGSSLLDIGTDHAYLPVYLIQNGACPFAYAADVGVGPLENAKKTVEKYGFNHKIQLLLSDGFDSVPDNCAADVAIAGMGGTLIVEILSRCLWIKNCSVRLVLQPMTHHEDVRRWLTENGFRIIEEAACFDDSRVYAGLAAEYDGKTRVKNTFYYVVGELPHSSYDRDAAATFLNKQYLRTVYRRDALKKCGRDEDEYKMLCEIAAEFEKILVNGELI